MPIQSQDKVYTDIQSKDKVYTEMKPSEIKKLDIVSISPPPGQDDWKTLFVEFGSEYQVDKVFQHTKYMTKDDHRVSHWFPVQMKERRQAIEKMAFEIREAGRERKVRTRVRVGREDIELSTKFPTGKWRRELLPADLPAVDFLYTPGSPQTSSPPPGRPCRDASKKRGKSSDSEGEDTSKKKKSDSQNSTEKDKSSEKQDHHRLTVPDSAQVQGEPGRFTGQEAYSPMTPAKIKYIPDLSVLINSPVFHRSQK